MGSELFCNHEWTRIDTNKDGERRILDSRVLACISGGSWGVDCFATTNGRESTRIKTARGGCLISVCERFTFRPRQVHLVGRLQLRLLKPSAEADQGDSALFLPP